MPVSCSYAVSSYSVSDVIIKADFAFQLAFLDMDIGESAPCAAFNLVLDFIGTIFILLL